jgi:hypothetical protein
VQPDQVQITWTKGSDIAGNPELLAYRVYLDDGSGNDPALVYDTGSRALTTLVTITDLMVGHTYSITVKAANVIGESLASAGLTVHAGVAPSQIKSFAWLSSTATSVTVRWGLPESNGGLALAGFTIYYTLFVDADANGIFQDTEIVGGADQQIEIADPARRTYTLEGDTGSFVDF